MKQINKKLLEALDKIIEKYSGEAMEFKYGVKYCPLCTLFYRDLCIDCPNIFFDSKQTLHRACVDRGYKHENLLYTNILNHNTLKQFWTNYKSLYVERKYTNSEIMEILIKNYEHTTTNN